MPRLGRYLDAELVERLDRIRPAGRRNVDGAAPGAHRSAIKGASLSFRQHRSYTRGDDPRRLDWRVLARTDRLFIKEFDHDTNLQCVLALDTSGSMAYGSAEAAAKSEYAATLATALAYLLLRGGESVGLTLLGSRKSQSSPTATGAVQLARIVDVVDHARFDSTADVASALHRFAAVLKRRSLLIILSDFFCPPGLLQQGLAQLSRAGHEAACVQVLHPDEVTFPFKTFMRLTSLESAAHRVVEPAMARPGYLQNFQKHAEALRGACTAGRAWLHTTRTDQPAILVIEQLLRQRPTRTL